MYDIIIFDIVIRFHVYMFHIYLDPGSFFVFIWLKIVLNEQASKCV